MNTQPELISVIIPALNEEKFLPGCLKSLRRQDYAGRYEIIVVDNGSTDGTARIARKFGAKLVSCSDQKSVFHARQAGADAASGDVIAQADADVVYPRDWLSKIALGMAAHPEAVALAGRYVYFDPPRWARLEYLARRWVNRLTVALVGRPLLISGATFAFRQQAFVAVGGYRGITYSADQYGISGRLSKMGKVVYYPELCVATSSRRVQMPLIRVLLAGSGNALEWLGLTLKGCLINLPALTLGTRARRLTSGATVLGLLMLLGAYGYILPTSVVFGKVYYKASPNEKVVALTFDDGPNDPYTSQVLDILDAHGIKATFFVVGKNVELLPETAKRMVAEGHVVANHSYTHNANHALTAYGGKDIWQAQLAIFSVLGVVPHLYRPPHGKKSPWELRAVNKLRLAEVTWSVSANELRDVAIFGKPSAAKVAREIVNEVKPGRIILLHDGYGTNHGDAYANKSLTVEALPLIIVPLEAKGYRFVTVPELLGIPAYNGPLDEP